MILLNAECQVGLQPAGAANSPGFINQTFENQKILSCGSKVSRFFRIKVTRMKFSQTKNLAFNFNHSENQNV